MYNKNTTPIGSMVKAYLENKIVKALNESELIEGEKSQILYKTERTGEAYRKGRRWVINNINKMSLTGLVTAGGMAYFFPRVAAGIGAVSCLGMGAKLAFPLDKFLYHNPKDVARRVFGNNIISSWHNAYNELEIKTRQELDNYVLMAQTSSSVQEAFPHYENKVALGIAIAKITDTLSGIDIDDPRIISGISLENLVGMISEQKFGSPEEVEAVRRLTEDYAPRKLTRLLRKIKKGKTRRMKPELFEKLSVLNKYTNNYEFVLRISEADNSESIGSQISRGHLVVSRSAGANAGCYAGFHSSGKDFPRMTINDDTGPSCGTHASRVLIKIGGDADQGVLDGATGGTAIVEGITKHDFAHHMTDSTWPAIAVSVGGIGTELISGNVLDGIVVSLNRAKIFHELPTIYRFENGKITQRITNEYHEQAPEQAAEIITNYIKSWKPRAA